jgi:putative CocE/NonD family hydrolase
VGAARLERTGGPERHPRGRIALLQRAFLQPLLLVLLLGQLAWAQPVSQAGLGDDGSFTFFLNDEPLSNCRFHWAPNGDFQSETEIKLGGQTVKSVLDMAVDSNGAWSKILIKSPTLQAEISREGNQVECREHRGTQKFVLKPDSLIFDSDAPALLATVIRRYDVSKGGLQRFPVLVLPSKQTEIAVELGQARAGLSGYRVELETVQLQCWVDAKFRLCLLELPQQHAVLVRSGYEQLRQPESTQEIVVEPNQTVPMRDAVPLAADIYRPKSAERVPVILMRTPYKKEFLELKARYYARRGYAVVVQDVRGRFESKGLWEPFVHEPQDGYDSVEYLASRPWSNGRVGMVGPSYLGWAGWWAASLQPPHLVTIIANVSPPDPFYNIPYEHGTFTQKASMWWADVLESNASGDLSGAALLKIEGKDYHRLMLDLPVIDLDLKVLGKRNPYWRKWLEHPSNDAYWARASFSDKFKQIKIPVFHQSGWFDGDGIGTKLNYLGMRQAGARNQKLTIGPWGHSDSSSRRMGERDFGPEAAPDLQVQYLRWFDHYLKGIDNGIDREPLVQIFLMGSNRWLKGDGYPLKGTQFDKWFLSQNRQLVKEQPGGRPESYEYDPGSPTPDWTQPPAGANAEDFQRSVLERKDLLVFHTPPMKQPYSFAGPLSAVIYAASSAKDTDFFVRLSDLDEHGRPWNLCLGKVRARFRESSKREKFLRPGEINAYHIDLWQMGLTVPVGHQLRVEISSAAFPTFSRNLNTGGHNETETKYLKATQTIYHDPAHPSHLLLPHLAD